MEGDSRRRSWEGPAEKLPAEIIGDILSRVEVARDVIKASLTCRQWREAYAKHMHALSFDASDKKFVYRKDPNPTPDIEMLITKVIFQSPGLRKLSIRMDFRHTFLASSVSAWLMLNRETLSELIYQVTTSTSVGVLDICDRQKLETLSLCDYTITGIEQNFQSFPCLTSLSLCRVGISVEDLNRFLSAFPKLKSLKLVSPFPQSFPQMHFNFSDPEKIVKVHCPTLKTLFLDDLKLFQFVLENSSIEYLQVKYCYFRSFKVYGSKTLRDLKISHFEARLLEIEQTDNLESFELVRSHVTRSNLFPMKMQSPKLKRFRFWGFKKYTSDEIILDDGSGRLVLNLQRMAICSPQLSHLAMLCDEGVDGLVYRFGRSTTLEKVAVLEIGWDGFDGFCKWAEKLLKCCPNVKKVIVHWVIPEDSDDSDYLKDLSEQSTTMVEMMMKYPHIQLQIAYMYDSDF